MLIRPPSGACTVALRRSIRGVPTNAATNTLAGSRRTSRAVPVCWITPSRMTATRSPSDIASDWSCVTYTVVTPRCRVSPAISARTRLRSLASRFDSGSSSRDAVGRRTIAGPMATRWRSPPESCAG